MNTRIICLATLAVSLVACSSTPDRNLALDQARERFGSAQRSTEVTSLAPDELKRAGETLQMAERAHTTGGTTSTVDHLAYLTSQRVTIARETASSKAAQAITAGAAAERDKMRLALRTDEADAAQRKLTQAQQDALRGRNSRQRSDARLTELESQLKDLNAKQTDRGLVVTLGDVLFDSGQARLLAGGTQNMSKLAEVLKRNPDRRASIEGYTDSIGSAKANQGLSERRASAVMTALVSLGVPSNRLSMLAHGEEMPVASNDTASGRQMNRRVEIVFAP